MIGGCSKSDSVIPSDTVNVGDYANSQDESSIIYALIEEDIFKVYPELKYQYQTELQKEMFLKSKEAKELKESMKKELDALLQKTYKMRFDLGSYDVKNEAFMIQMGMLLPGWYCFDKSDVPIRLNKGFFGEISRHIVLKFEKEKALELERSDSEVYLIFNPTDSVIECEWDIHQKTVERLSQKAYVGVKDVGLVVVDKSTKKSLYAIKFSDFDEKKVWKKTDPANIASLSPLQQVPAVKNIEAESKESIELPQSVRKEIPLQTPSAQISKPSSIFNEELLGIKYFMTVDNGIVYCNVDDSWVSISDDEKRNFGKQIGQKKYFGKTQFTIKNSGGTNLAEYNSGNIKIFKTRNGEKKDANLIDKYPPKKADLSAIDEQNWQSRIEIARDHVKYQEGRVETFKRDLDIARRNPREARDSEESLKSILIKEEKKLDDEKQEYKKVLERARSAGVKVL